MGMPMRVVDGRSASTPTIGARMTRAFVGPSGYRIIHPEWSDTLFGFRNTGGTR